MQMHSHAQQLLQRTPQWLTWDSFTACLRAFFSSAVSSLRRGSVAIDVAIEAPSSLL